MKKTSKTKSRLMCCLLYPEDNADHKEALETLQKYYNCLTINHNQDIYLYDEMDEQGNIKHSAGELKKAHYHCLIQFQNARYISGVAKELNIEEHLVQKCSSFDSYVNYMVHRDEPLKHQYDISDLNGLLLGKAVRVLESPKDESDQFLDVVRYIETHPNISLKDLGVWCGSFGYYSVFRRNFTFFKEVYYEEKEKNRKFGNYI